MTTKIYACAPNTNAPPHSLLLPLEEGLAATVDLLDLGVEGLLFRRSSVGREGRLLVGGVGIGTLLAGGRRYILGRRRRGGSLVGLFRLLLLEIVSIVIGGGAGEALRAAFAAQHLPQQQRGKRGRRNAEGNRLRAVQFVRHRALIYAVMNEHHHFGIL